MLGFANRPAAQLVATTDCRWSDAAAAIPTGSDLRPGQRIDLAAGDVQIAFARGGVLTLHGPSVLEIESQSCARLLVGNVSAHAETERSHGFTLRLPTASVVDLGTEFQAHAAADGHSRVDVISGAVELRTAGGDTTRRLEKGQAVQIESGERSVLARIEPGDGTPAFKFPTIEPPSADDYADASQGRAQIRVLRGAPRRDDYSRSYDSGPVEVLLNGKGQSTADSPHESFFFENDTSGMILLNLGQAISVKKVNTYSWHRCNFLPSEHNRAMQRYDLYGSPGPTLPPANGNLAAAGWTLIARVNTDEFFGFPRQAARPVQQGVSITSADGGSVGKYRYLLWDVHPAPPEAGDPAAANAFYGEFDVYRAEED